MEIPLSAALQDRLAQLSQKRGRDAQTLVIEAIENLVSYDEWFGQQVDAGIVAADQGFLLDHDEVRSIIDRRYPQH
jgi:predicted transcriptional regulator